MNTTAREAYSIALTPWGVSDEWAALPRNVISTRLIDLWAAMTRMLVGSPTMQVEGRSPLATRSWTSCAPPPQPTSSS